MEQFFQIGVITSTHGLKGEVKVFPTTDYPEQFETLKTLYLDDGKTRRTVEIERVKYFKQFIILKMKEFSRIEDVERLRQAKLLIDREHAVPCEEGEYYVVDLIGLNVYDEKDQFLGELTDVLETGANDVYEVTMEDGKTVLLPAIKDCIQNIDIQNRRMDIFLMPGLLD